VEQLHRLALSLEAPADVRPDSTVAVNVTVSNLGNGRESLSLAAGTRNGWELAPPPLPFVLNLSAGEANTTTLNVIVPLDALSGPTGFVNFKATTADGLYQANETKVMTVLPKRDMRLGASVTRLTLKTGERRNITLSFDNRGNVRENGTLVLSGDFLWATLENASLNITPFTKMSVNLSVEGKRPGGNLSVSFRSDSEGLRAVQNISVSVTANATNATGQTPPANALLVMAVGTAALVAVVAFILWDLRRHEEKERMERGRYERIAARRPQSAGRTPPPDRKGTGKSP
jgi:hypothetical protein